MTAAAVDAPTARAPLWRRGTVWALVGAIVVGGGLLLAALGSGGGTSVLDPRSTQPSGSRALARVLAGYGTTVAATRSLNDVRSAGVVLVTDPDAYSDAQLRALADEAGRVVLVDPGVRALRAVSSIEPDTDLDPEPDPGCDLRGAQVAGEVDVRGGEAFVGGTTRCYGGFVAVEGNVVALGSADLLRNDRLADRGVAALDVNLLSADRTADRLVWLRPGSDADGTGAASVWDVLPDWSHRAFLWMILVGVVVVLWRARRLGPAVAEPMPVVVRAAELSEGQARLHHRAGARDRAADTLRAAARRRTATRLGLPRGASAEQLAAAASPVTGWPPAAVHAVLAGPTPVDDAALVQVAAGLDALEAALRGGPDARPSTTRTDRTDERTTPR